jgi:AIPR protein
MTLGCSWRTFGLDAQSQFALTVFFSKGCSSHETRFCLWMTVEKWSAGPQVTYTNGQGSRDQPVGLGVGVVRPDTGVYDDRYFLSRGESLGMSIIQVNHIQSNCRSRFSALIDMSDVTKTDAEERDSNFLTRALAAFCVAALAKVDDTTAANSVVDEYHDDGIDAFYFDRVEHVAYLVQTKWIKNGGGSVDVGSVLKFLRGFNHFLEGKLDQLGPRMQKKSQEMQEVVADSHAKFVLVIGYTGKPALSAEVQAPIDQLLQDLNDDGDFVSVAVLKQKELHGVVEQLALGASIDLTILLQEYGVVREPYRAYYGQINVEDILAWGKFGDHLYHKNIRGFKGSTEVNDSIVKTVRDSPDNFLSFNNGITLLCTKIEKQPLGGRTRSSGVFECKGASVVNGAQTVGSVISALSTPPTSSSARVMIRLISLEDCPPDFGFDVTRATNTQNRIEKRDFAALDTEQSRLRSEMFLSLNKEYVFRTGDIPPTPDAGCTLDEAAVALACAQPDITYCMIAKREVSRLYDDIEKAPYKVLFNSSLSAVRMWRAVEALRIVDGWLKVAAATRDGKDKLVAIHGNRMVLYLIFRKSGEALFDASQIDVTEAKTSVDDCIDAITAQILIEYSTSYPAQLFKNITKCKRIAAAII